MRYFNLLLLALVAIACDEQEVVNNNKESAQYFKPIFGFELDPTFTNVSAYQYEGMDPEVLIQCNFKNIDKILDFLLHNNYKRTTELIEYPNSSPQWWSLPSGNMQNYFTKIGKEEKTQIWVSSNQLNGHYFTW